MRHGAQSTDTNNLNDELYNKLELLALTSDDVDVVYSFLVSGDELITDEYIIDWIGTLEIIQDYFIYILIIEKW